MSEKFLSCFVCELLRLRTQNWIITECGVLWFQKPVPDSVKPAASTLFGDEEDDDDLFSSAKPKAPPVIQLDFFL